MAEKHIINKVYLELEVNDSRDSFDMNTRIRDIVMNQIMPQLERWFDQWLAKHQLNQQVLRIDQLSLDLGTLDLHLSDSSLEQEIWKQVELDIESIFQEQLKDKKAFQSSRESSVLEGFQHYLLYGHLPWNIILNQGQDFYDQVLESISGASNQEKSKLIRILNDNSSARIRLTRQFPLDKLQTFFTNLGADSSSVFSFYQEKILGLNHESSVLRQMLPLKSIEPFLQHSLARLVLENLGNPSRKVEWIKKRIFELFIETFPNTPPQLLEAWKVELKIKNDPELRSVKPNSFQAKHEIKLFKSKEKAKLIIEEEAVEFVFVENAGLVILHPFLPIIFREFDWLIDGQFKDEDSQLLAVNLLQYLVNGSKEAPEYEMTLNKILVGLDMDHILERKNTITEVQEKEARQLLQAVITNWTKLGTASAEALQEGFIQRPGKLSKSENGWLLQVEERGVDILLDSLPWNLSLIKLPWLDSFINVEWRL